MHRLASLPLFLAIAAQSLDAASYLHPKLKNKAKTIGSVTLLPPTAQMTAEGFIRDDIKEKEAEPLASAIAAVMSSALKKRGWEVNDSAFASRALQDKEELRYLVGYLRTRHQTLVGRIKPKDISKGRCSLGDRVAALGAQADVLVLVHGDGHRLTKAGWARQVGFSGAMWGLTGSALAVMFETLEKHVSLRISLVDSRTGEILCYSKVSGAGEKQIVEELSKVP